MEPSPELRAPKFGRKAASLIAGAMLAASITATPALAEETPDITPPKSVAAQAVTAGLGGVDNSAPPTADLLPITSTPPGGETPTDTSSETPVVTPNVTPPRIPRPISRPEILMAISSP